MVSHIPSSPETLEIAPQLFSVEPGMEIIPLPHAYTRVAGTVHTSACA